MITVVWYKELLFARATVILLHITHVGTHFLSCQLFLGPLQDPVTTETASKKQEFHHSKVGQQAWILPQWALKSCYSGDFVSLLLCNAGPEKGRGWEEEKAPQDWVAEENVRKRHGANGCTMLRVGAELGGQSLPQVSWRYVAGSPRSGRDNHLSSENGCRPTGGVDRHPWAWGGGGGRCWRTSTVDQCSQLRGVSNLACSMCWQCGYLYYGCVGDISIIEAGKKCLESEGLYVFSTWSWPTKGGLQVSPWGCEVWVTTSTAPQVHHRLVPLCIQCLLRW